MKTKHTSTFTPKFIKNTKRTTITTSVTITKKQYKFIQKKNLNFSAIVQDVLNQLIGESSEQL